MISTDKILTMSRGMKFIVLMNIGIIIFEALSYNLKGVITVGIATGFVIPIFIMCSGLNKRLDVIEGKIKEKESMT